MKFFFLLFILSISLCTLFLFIPFIVSNFSITSEITSFGGWRLWRKSAFWWSRTKMCLWSWVLSFSQTNYRFYGEDCNQSCPGLDRDTTTDEIFECNGFGFCNTTTFQCDCFSFASGEDCSLVCDGSEYDEENKREIECAGHGTCSFTEEAALCTCTKGYYGSGCEESCPGLLEQGDSVVECSGNGNCIYSADDETAVCKCYDNYWGESCTDQCPGIVEEKGVRYSCSNHGSCNENGKCECSVGFYGEACDKSCPGLMLDSDGNVVECSGHGTCDPSTFTCKCRENRYVDEDCRNKNRM